MIVASWNVRGFSEPLRRREILHMCNKKKIDILGILETKIKDEEVQEAMSMFREEWKWLVASNFGKSRIIVIWRANTVSISASKIQPQYVSCDVFFKNPGSAGRVIFVYGNNRSNERLNLWHQLRMEIDRVPSLIVGDFNATLKQHERRGTLSTASPEDALIDFVEEMEVIDSPATGCFFTWTNRRSGEDSIVVKLDRAMTNSLWVEIFPATKAHFFEPLQSDHSLVLVELMNPWPSRPKPFKFFNSWTKHHEFHGLVRRIWNTDIWGSPMFVISKKLKLVKEVLKEFNRSVYLPELKASLNLEQELRATQQRLLSLHPNPDDDLKEVELVQRYVKARLMEEEAAQQKSRILWLERGDFNTSFFHKKPK